jgi:hypothetical protein
MLLTRVSPQTISAVDVSSVQWWPFLALAAFEFTLGLTRRDSHRLFVATCSALIGLQFMPEFSEFMPAITRGTIAAGVLTASILAIGAVYRDDFAWLLRLMGAPLLVVITVMGCVFVQSPATGLPVWTGYLIVIATPLLAFGYAAVLRIPLYRLSGLLCTVSGTLGMTEFAVLYVIRASSWQGATSFMIGIDWLLLAIAISSWKAGWFKHVPAWLRGMLAM